MDGSDYFPVFLILKNIFVKECSSKKVEFRIVSDSNLEKLHNNLSKIPFTDFIDLDDPDDAFDSFCNIIMREFNLCCPIKKKKHQKH